jgi:hypothetical protein
MDNASFGVYLIGIFSNSRSDHATNSVVIIATWSDPAQDTTGPRPFGHAKEREERDLIIVAPALLEARRWHFCRVHGSKYHLIIDTEESLATCLSARWNDAKNWSIAKEGHFDQQRNLKTPV